MRLFDSFKGCSIEIPPVRDGLVVFFIRNIRKGDFTFPLDFLHYYRKYDIGIPLDYDNVEKLEECNNGIKYKEKSQQ